MARKNYVRGLPQANRAFRRAPALARQGIVNALNKGAEEIRDRAEQIAPHDPRTPIDLKDHIEVRLASHSRALKGGGTSEGVRALVVAGDTPERAQAAFRAEFGRAPGPDGHPGHAAQEFLFPAYWSLRKRVRGRVKRAITAAAKMMRAK